MPLSTVSPKHDPMYGSEQRTHIKVGAITLVALILLLVGITIGRGVNLSTAPVQLRIRAASAEGLESGAPVWINGIKRGTVLSVRPDGDSVLITAGIDDASMLRADAHAQIAMLEITGGKRLDIIPGTDAERWSGTVLRAKGGGDLTSLASSIAPLAGRAERLLERLDTTIAAANAVLADRSVQENIRTAVTQLAELSAELRSIVAANRSAVETIVADVRSLGGQLRDAVEQNRPTVERLLERLDRTSNELEHLTAKASTLASRADTTLSNLNEILRELRSQRTVLGRLLSDEQLALSLDTTLRRVGGVLDTIARYGVNVNVRLGTRP